jgi:hypothetical protein
MEQIIKKPIFLKLRQSQWLFGLLPDKSPRPAPASQLEIDRLAQGWEHHSESTRAKMARIGI